MNPSITDQIALVETHIELETAAKADCEHELALYPTVVPEHAADIERCGRELVIWHAILESLRKLNIH